METLRISDSRGDNVLAPTLKDVLAIAPTGQEGSWLVREMSLLGYGIDSDFVKGVEARVASATWDVGCRLSWEELSRVAASLPRLIDFTADLTAPSGALVMQVALVDSTYWQIRTDEPHVIERARSKWRAVSTVRGETENGS